MNELDPDLLLSVKKCHLELFTVLCFVCNFQIQSYVQYITGVDLIGPILIFIK